MANGGTSNGGDQGGGGAAPISIPGLPAFTVQATDIAPPDTPTDFPRQHVIQYFRDVYTELKNISVPSLVAQLIAGFSVTPAITFTVCKDVLIAILKVMLPTWGKEILDALDDLRKAIDPSVSELAVDVLNELLGTSIAATDMPTGGAFGDHLARADKIGGILHDTLMQEFQGLNAITPQNGQHAARRFTGLMINFGTATGVLATLSGLVPFIHLDDIREIGEQVAQNLGLGRLGRQVLRPIVQILIEEPYKWFINQQYRPTIFSAADCVNPYTNQTLSADQMHADLALQGYSNDRIKALIELHQKKLSENDYFYLWQMGLKQGTDFVAYLQKLGYSADDARSRMDAEQLRASEGLEHEIVAAAMEAYVAGHITQDEWNQVLQAAHVVPNNPELWTILAQYKAKVPHKALTLAEVTDMLAQDVISLDEFEDYLTKFGYSLTDANNLKIWTLLKLNAKEEAAKAKAAKAAAKTTTTATAPTTTTTSAPGS
jgi:hypothetical protein